MLCVTVTGLWVSERRAEAISKIRLCLPGVRSGLVACCWLVFGPMSDLNANFKKLKKVVTSEPIETKEVTKFFVNRKIKELKPK